MMLMIMIMVVKVQVGWCDNHDDGGDDAGEGGGVRVGANDSVAMTVATASISANTMRQTLMKALSKHWFGPQGSITSLKCGEAHGTREFTMSDQPWMHLWLPEELCQGAKEHNRWDGWN